MIKTEMFEPVLEWLDAGAPHTQGFGFNMSWFHGRSFDCGTVCCIAGALAQFNKLPEDESFPLAPFLNVANSVGMTPKQMMGLFFASPEDGARYPLRSGELMFFNDITLAIAAKTIRHMLETGEVKWT